MRRLRDLVLIVAGVIAASPATAEQLPSSMGWHSWRSAAIESGAAGCCYRWSFGEDARGACRLTHGGMEAAETAPPTAPLSSGRLTNEIRVFARLNKGQIVDAHALATNCPVQVQVDLEDLGVVDAKTSIDWLSAAWRDGHRSDDQLLHVLSQHNGGDEALIRLVEDQGLEHTERKAALFWLANTASESAVAWFDGLLRK